MKKPNKDTVKKITDFDEDLDTISEKNIHQRRRGIQKRVDCRRTTT